MQARPVATTTTASDGQPTGAVRIVEVPSPTVEAAPTRQPVTPGQTPTPKPPTPTVEAPPTVAPSTVSISDFITYITADEFDQMVADPQNGLFVESRRSGKAPISGAIDATRTTLVKEGDETAITNVHPSEFHFYIVENSDMALVEQKNRAPGSKRFVTGVRQGGKLDLHVENTDIVIPLGSGPADRSEGMQIMSLEKYFEHLNSQSKVRISSEDLNTASAKLQKNILPAARKLLREEEKENPQRSDLVEAGARTRAKGQASPVRG